mgnify:CR=1 FL=1
MPIGGSSRETSTAGPAKAAAVAVLAAAISAGVTFSVMRRPVRLERDSEIVYVLPPAPDRALEAPVAAGVVGAESSLADSSVRAAVARIEKVVAEPIVEPTVLAEERPTARTVPGKIHLNTASQAELELLPDVGPKMAKAILDYRKVHGPFKSVAELDKVKGIGERTLKRLAPLVTVD